MRVRAELRVEKRDGRVEWLRATKLIRSILIALAAEQQSAVTPRVAGDVLRGDSGGQSVVTGDVPAGWPGKSDPSAELVSADQDLAHEIAERVLVRARAVASRTALPIPSSVLWAAVRDELVAKGRPMAASCFSAVRTERERRARLLRGAAMGGAPRLGHAGPSFGRSGSDCEVLDGRRRPDGRGPIGGAW